MIKQMSLGNTCKYKYLTWDKIIREKRLTRLDLVVVDCASLVKRLDDIYESTQASFYVFIS